MYTTLYHLPVTPGYWDKDIVAKVSIPQSFGFDPKVVGEQSVNESEVIRGEMLFDEQASAGYARLFAALSEAKRGELRVLRLGPGPRDIHWWYGLQKKLKTIKQYPHIVITPAGYLDQSNTKWPLILFLHGSGEEGTNLEVIRGEAIVKGLANYHAGGFILLAPQTPVDDWDPWLLKDLIDDTVAKYHVDTDRIYLTGLSLGGIGSYEMVSEFPHLFAAVAPLCGYGDPDDALQIRTCRSGRSTARSTRRCRLPRTAPRSVRC